MVVVALVFPMGLVAPITAVVAVCLIIKVELYSVRVLLRSNCDTARMLARKRCARYGYGGCRNSFTDGV